MPKIKNSYLALSALIISLLYTSSAFAICPVCTIVIGAGVGLSRWLGIDDTISGIWIGALLASLIGWTIDYLNRKKIKFYGRKILVTIGYYAFVALPLYWTDLLWHPTNKIWGMDKLMVGIAVGTVVFLISVISYFYMKKHNDGHAYFKGQKIAMPIVSLLISSIVFYFITK